MELTILSVTQLNQTVKSLVDSEPALQSVCVRGELSNYKVYPSGHHYFSLKDAESSLRCVMFKGSTFSLRFRPQNGMAVVAIGRISVFPRDGAYQLYCSHMIPDGAGDLNSAFEKLKQKLYQEGLFDQTHKKPLPAFPHRIGIVTSPAGAAVHDMLRILGARYPLSKVLLFPVRVQGENAAEEIAEAVEFADRHHLADVLIVGRGGGSAEDLWPFNEEIVARAIYHCSIPVVSAVGHEPDVTISDFVADVRAATPSNAAELVAPDKDELQERLLNAQRAVFSAFRSQLADYHKRLDRVSQSPALRHPERLLRDKQMRLDLAVERLANAQKNVIRENKERYLRLSERLDALSPLKVLQRGYSVAMDRDGAVVRSVHSVRSGDCIDIVVADGTIRTAVESVKEENHESSFREF